jgi:hypothetical protein
MNFSSVLTRPTRPLLAGFVLVAIASVAIGWTAGTVAASSGSRGSSPSAAPKAAVAPGVPGVEIHTQQAGNATTTSGGATSSAIYPVPGYNSLGVAPEGTILVEGTGTADVKADGSDAAVALKKATDLALNDAHGQALAVTASMGLQLKAIYSISIATNTNYTYPILDCAIPPVTPGLEGGAPAAGGAAVLPGGSPAICIQTKTVTPTSSQLVVTLIVAYRYA